jgi:methionine-rich copper-binding protein CopC
MRRLAFVAWAGLVLAAMMLTAALTAQVASAHATRVSAEPADNAVLATGPARVSATFNERLQTTFAAMTVVGPDGNRSAPTR